MATSKTPSKGAKPDKLWRDALMVAVHRAAVTGFNLGTKPVKLGTKPVKHSWLVNKCNAFW